tara:strand:+ start:2712 stop:5771 length:3060 start_codon:yes stop_codon:yes gene_type:complete
MTDLRGYYFQMSEDGIMKNRFLASIALLSLVAACAKKSDSMVGQDPILQAAYQSIATTQAQVEVELKAWDKHNKGLDHDHAHCSKLFGSQTRLEQQMSRVRAKQENKGLAATNQRSISRAMEGHTKVYKFEGEYNVMVIPVQFSDFKMEDIAFFTPDENGKIKAQEYLFGDSNPDSLRQYYKHASMGKFLLDGEVTPVVTVPNTLANYGESVPGNTDRNARGLVVDVLERLKEQNPDIDWWDRFDQWDLSDYDNDGNFHEPDGFIDAVVLVYAGKSQASCQADFDTTGTRPPNSDVPAGPRYNATIECYNRIWPHRWGISLAPTDSRYSEKGPVVEGRQRPSMNGYKIHDGLFATDYNMQSEFSDLSTFMHEFGHSLTLPDVYSRGAGNSTGSWELMSNNAPLRAQELSTFSKVSLGWVSPKIIRQGETTSAYLGAYNFVATAEREGELRVPKVREVIDGQEFNFDAVSLVPGLGEAVYRSAIVLTEPSKEEVKVVEPVSRAGSRSAYSGRFDGESRSMKFDVSVPLEGSAEFSFDTIYHIETETNFLAQGEDQLDVKVTVDYDIGEIKVNGKTVEQLRIVSGDDNFDTLNENLEACNVAEILALRTKNVKGELSKPEQAAFKEKAAECQKPSWVKKTVDLSEFKGKDVTVEIVYTTDAGYTEFGIVLDNVQAPGAQAIDFENIRTAGDIPGSQFQILVAGKYDIFHNQFYLMEYRTPGEHYRQNGEEVSYNKDNNIMQGEQSFFAKEGADLREKFRLVESSYQPGVLVWYYNTKFGRTENNPTGQDGKGYLLVLNSKVKEMALPSELGNAEFFDEEGFYNTDSAAYKAFVKEQNEAFVCFSHTSFFTYTEGKAPECDDVSAIDAMKELTFAGRPLIYRREGFNQVLPPRRMGFHSVGNPMRRGAASRTGLSTFRPKAAGDFAPYKVYKEHYGEMVIDQLSTSQAPTFASVSTFSDADNTLSTRAAYQGDSVVVEKTGFNFEVVMPSKRVLERYSKQMNAESGENYFRRPRVKIYFDWK